MGAMGSSSRVVTERLGPFWDVHNDYIKQTVWSAKQAHASVAKCQGTSPLECVSVIGWRGPLTACLNFPILPSNPIQSLKNDAYRPDPAPDYGNQDRA